ELLSRLNAKLGKRQSKTEQNLEVIAHATKKPKLELPPPAAATLPHQPTQAAQPTASMAAEPLIIPAARVDRDERKKKAREAVATLLSRLPAPKVSDVLIDVAFTP